MVSSRVCVRVVAHAPFLNQGKFKPDKLVRALARKYGEEAVAHFGV
jgi:hypothetical protein